MKIKSLGIFSIAALVALLSAVAAIPAAVSAQTGDDTDHDNDADVTNLTGIPVTGTPTAMARSRAPSRSMSSFPGATVSSWPPARSPAK